MSFTGTHSPKLSFSLADFQSSYLIVTFGDERAFILCIILYIVCLQ
jgi:hypothetical protein